MRHRRSIRTRSMNHAARHAAEYRVRARSKALSVCTDHSNTSTACQSSPEAVNPTHASVCPSRKMLSTAKGTLAQGFDGVVEVLRECRGVGGVGTERGGETGDFAGFDGEEHVVDGNVGGVADVDLVDETVVDGTVADGTVEGDGGETALACAVLADLQRRVYGDVTLARFLKIWGVDGVEFERDRYGIPPWPRTDRRRRDRSRRGRRLCRGE